MVGGLRDGNPTPCRPVIYLCRAVARGLKRSTPRQMGEQPIRSRRPQGPEQRSTAGILDLATHQTVRRANSRWRPVGSYPAFSPLPAGHSPECGPEPRRLRPFRECPPAGGRSLLRSHNLTAVKSLACVALCVARTFLSRPAAGSDRADLRGKDRHFGGKNLRRRRIFPPCGRRLSARPLRPGPRAVVFRLRAAVRGCALRSGRVCRACSGTAGRSRSASRPPHGGARRRRSCRGRGSGPCPSCPRRRRAGARWRCA